LAGVYFSQRKWNYQAVLSKKCSSDDKLRNRDQAGV
jgi:hypothetical protein